MIRITFTRRIHRKRVAILHYIILNRRPHFLLLLFHDTRIALSSVKCVHVLFELLLFVFFFFGVDLMVGRVAARAKYIINKINLMHTLRILSKPQRRGKCIQKFYPFFLIIDFLLLVLHLWAHAHGIHVVRFHFLEAEIFDALGAHRGELIEVFD